MADAGGDGGLAEGFAAPDFGAALRLDEELAALPADETCKGFLCAGVIDLARKLCPGKIEHVLEGLPARRFVPFREYPMRDHLRLLENAVGVLYPGLAVREAMRRMGRLVQPLLAESMVGTLVDGLVGADPDACLAATPRVYELTYRRGRIRLWRVGERHWRGRLDRVVMCDCYHVGVIEGALRMHRVEASVLVRAPGPSTGELDITWP